MEKLINQFIESQKALQEAINKFPKEKRGDKYFGIWDLKDVVAHFAAWDIFFTNCLKLLKAEKEIPYWGSINEFNKEEVERRKDWSWDKVYSEFSKSGDDFIQEYKNLPTNLINQPLWKGKTYTPLKLLNVNIHHYQKAQLVEIKKLLNKWGL